MRGGGCNFQFLLILTSSGASRVGKITMGTIIMSLLYPRTRETESLLSRKFGLPKSQEGNNQEMRDHMRVFHWGLKILEGLLASEDG